MSAQLLRVGQGFLLDEVDPESTPGYPRSKKRCRTRPPLGRARAGRLQERLYAQSRVDATHASVLLVLQAMDSAGKGGILRHVVGSVDPQGVTIAAFKKPTAEELAHDFLWRVKKRVPTPGTDRRLRPLALRGRADRTRARTRPARGDRAPLRRDQQIREEADGCRHPRRQGHAAHLARRAAGPAHGAARTTRQALEVQPRRRRRARALAEVHGGVPDGVRAHVDRPTPRGSSFPANRKWYARIAVQHLLLEALEDIDPHWPAATYVVEAEKARLAAS